MVDHFADGGVHGEIERRGQVRVDAVEALLASGKIGDHGRLEVIDLADGEEVGIRRLQPLQVSRPEGARHVGKGVDAEAVDAADFHPPVGVLQEIFGNQRIFLREVRQDIGKPAVERAAVVLLDRVRIGHRRIVVVGIDVIFGGAVQPSRRRLRRRPGMLGSYVVRNHVEQNLDSLLMGGVDQLLKLLQRAEVVLDRVKIGRAVAVVGLAELSLSTDGIQPQRRDAEVLEVGRWS